MSSKATAAPAEAVTLVHVDMPSEIVDIAVKKAQEAVSTHKVEKDMAMHVKKAMEAHDGAMWHVVVGASFGMSVSNENNRVLLFRIGKLNFLVFQTFDESSLVRREGATAHVHRGAQEAKKGADEDDEDA